MANETSPGSAPRLIGIEREWFSRAADMLAVAAAVVLPWSTSALAIVVVLWVLAFIPNASRDALSRVLLSAAGGLPVLLWILGVAGMAWADVSWTERLNGLNSFHKLLLIPLFLAHFQQSERGQAVMVGFLASCVVYLGASWLSYLVPGFPHAAGKHLGIPAKDHIARTALFTISIAILIAQAVECWKASQKMRAAAYALLVAAFLLNIFIVATSRMAFVVLPIIFLLFGLKFLDWRGAVGLLIALAMLAAVGWQFSPYMRARVTTFFTEVENYRSDGARTPSAERLEFWKKSVGFVAAAPIIGHGTGSISDQFRRSTKDQTGVAALAADNPHNQTLAVAIQLGAVGVGVLMAMWLAHFLLFRGGGMAAWVGFAVVVQNFVGSLFNTHIFDFTHGWGYVIGVGVAGGMVLKAARDAQTKALTI